DLHTVAGGGCGQPTPGGLSAARHRSRGLWNLALVERRLVDGGGEDPAAHGDADGGAGLGIGRVVGDVAEPDALAEHRRLRAAGDLADGRALGVGDGVTLARDAALLHHEPDEPARHAALLLRRERAAPDELALVELGDPAEAGLERGRLLSQ